MKLPKLPMLVSLLIIAVTLSQCKKKKEELQLPPETTTGAMTFGCKVNGQIFLPQDGRGRPGLYVQYVYLGSGAGGGWYLNIPAFDYQSSLNKGVSIETDSLLLSEGNTYDFKNSKGNPKAFYIEEIAGGGGSIYTKLDNDNGTLGIKKFDKLNRIISGTFSFVGTNSNGNKVNITEGRFDIRY